MFECCSSLQTLTYPELIVYREHLRGIMRTYTPKHRSFMSVLKEKVKLEMEIAHRDNEAQTTLIQATAL